MAMIGGNLLRLLFLCVACSAAAWARPPDPVEQLKTCAKTADRDARIACYEALGRQVLQAGANPATGAATATAEAAATPTMRDDLGGGQFSDKAEPADDVNRGLLTSCKMGPTNRWYFYFDNGQVWKQVNNGRVHFDDCKRVATISKDWFGYTLEIEGRKGKIRIARVK